MKKEMKSIKNFKTITLLIILTVNIFLYVQFIKINGSLVDSKSEIEYQSIIKNDSDISQINGANSSPANETISGIIDQRDGKIFSNVSINCSNCFINQYDLRLNQQPKIDIQDWNLTYALMYFDNITAINYTRDIETETNEYIESHNDPLGPNKPIYIYQKFSIEISQYINNVSIFLQDICDLDNYNDENSWEVAILNCSNDIYGTPDAELVILQNPHPINYAAHWEIFDFLNSEVGSIFLNKSKTNWTEDELLNRKYWYCIRIKIPPNDEATGGGPKFLYMNPDGVDFTYIGEGDTYKKFEEVNTGIITNVNNVSGYLIPPENGTQLDGSLESFKEIEDDRYFAKPLTDNLTIAVNFTISNLTLYPYTYEYFKNNNSLWNGLNHFNVLYHIDLHIATNYSGNVDTAILVVRDYSQPGDVWRSFYEFIDINQTEELEQYARLETFDDKDNLLDYMYTTDDVNNLTFALYYNGAGSFNVTINKFSIDFVEKKQENNLILPYDPIIKELNFPNEDNPVNDSDYYGEQDLEDLRLNDDNFYRAQADTNNLSIEFDFNILSQINSSYWEMNLWDYLLLYPNPVIPLMELRISQNVSITSSNNLSLAILEVYKGNKTLDFLTPEQNQLEWIQFTPDNKTFANITEKYVSIPFYFHYTWLALQFVISSANNTLRVRLRYMANESQSLTKFNVSIDEFSLLIHVQNVISSDITCKIGLGLDSNNLKPTDIEMKNFGIEIDDYENNKGIWENASFSTWENASFGIPTLGNFYFEVTSKWNSITFNVIGIYQIERCYDFQWEYYLTSDNSKILWNITSGIDNFHENSIIGSQGLKVAVSDDWSLMQIYNDTISDGYWNWNSQVLGILKSIEVYNISVGTWKIQMNSSITPMTVVYNVSNNIKIDRYIQADISILTDYGGDLKFEIFDAQPKSIWEDNVYLNLSSLENSHIFVWDIFDTTQSDGTYYLKSSWIKYNQTHAFLSLETKQIIVSKYNSKLELFNIEENYENNSIFGTEIKIQGKLLNNETDVPIAGETIYVEIYSENEIIDVKSDISNEEGIIQLVYDLPEEIEGYNSITIKLVYNQTDSYYETVESGELVIINLISQGQAFFNTFLMYLPYIAIIGAVIAGTLTVRHQRLSKARKKWAKDALILDDLLKISYIMIILKDSGVSIYNKLLSAKEIEPDLISGFLHAVAQFKREIKRDLTGDEGSKGFEMDYGDFKIVITDGRFIRIAFILEETPSYQLKEKQTALTNAFEHKFRPYIEKFTGDLAPFSKTDELIEKYFSPSLTYPLVLGKYRFVYTGKLKPLESALIEVAEQIQKEKKFFFVSNLLNYGLAGRKESRDHILSSIIFLKQKGILEPYEFNL